MSYQKPRTPVQFAPLQTTLARSQALDPAAYQVIQELINRTTSLNQTNVDMANANQEQNITIVRSIDSGVESAKSQTYLTVGPETGDLPSSVQLLAGTGITFDDSVQNRRTINASGGGSGSNEAVVAARVSLGL
jgi:hypothetical protein